MSTNDYAILYNPISGNNQGEAVAKALKEKLNAQRKEEALEAYISKMLNEARIQVKYN